MPSRAGRRLARHRRRRVVAGIGDACILRRQTGRAEDRPREARRIAGRDARAGGAGRSPGHVRALARPPPNAVTARVTGVRRSRRTRGDVRRRIELPRASVTAEALRRLRRVRSARADVLVVARLAFHVTSRTHDRKDARASLLARHGRRRSGDRRRGAGIADRVAAAARAATAARAAAASVETAAVIDATREQRARDGHQRGGSDEERERSLHRRLGGAHDAASCSDRTAHEISPSRAKKATSSARSRGSSAQRGTATTSSSVPQVVEEESADARKDGHQDDGCSPLFRHRHGLGGSERRRRREAR
jgi:hypothetical protein